MKNKRYIKYTLIFLGIVVIWNAMGYFISINHRKKVESHPIRYYYHSINVVPNPVEAIEDLGNKDSLIKMYEEWEDGKFPITNFDSYPLPMDEPLYVLGYEGKDSLIAHIYYYTHKGKGYFDGYVLSKYLHKKPVKKGI